MPAYWLTPNVRTAFAVCAPPRYLPAESGEVEHRDYVLSAKDREQRVILCCARTKVTGAELVVDL